MPYSGVLQSLAHDTVPPSSAALPETLERGATQAQLQQRLHRAKVP